MVYGFFGLMVIVPTISSLFGGFGWLLLAVIIILSMMILPTVVSITVGRDSRRAQGIPGRGSLALGATKTLFHQSRAPAAKKTILTGVVLGRAVRGRDDGGAAGPGQPGVPAHLHPHPTRTLTGNQSRWNGLRNRVAPWMRCTAGVVLFVFIMALNPLFTGAAA